jgi:DNA-binding transcriptional regulator LsrR (DeoR family)
MSGKIETETTRLDEAARAGWLYYVAGNTQEEVARKLNVSRQSAQRLVALAVSEKLVKVRLDHPIAHCMELANAMIERYGLLSCEIIPSEPNAGNSTVGLAEAGASAMERHLKSVEPIIVAVGTGRVLRASVEQLAQLQAPQHRIVSLLGNITSDGSATPYDVAIRMAERINGRYYPMPLPVYARSAEERKFLHNQDHVRSILELCKQADVTFVGIGGVGEKAPILLDGFLTPAEIDTLQNAGAVGEIISWAYDKHGQMIKGLNNERVNNAPIVPTDKKPVYGIAAGDAKLSAIAGALAGNLVNSLITNEYTAKSLLKN